MQRWWDLLIPQPGDQPPTPEQEMTMPWWADRILITFADGLTLTSSLVARQEDDTLKVGVDRPGAEPGTPVTIEWTANNRGCRATGTVASATDDVVRVRLDQAVTGVQRRAGVRIPVYLPVTVSTADGGDVAGGRTYDLSIGGTRIGLNSTGDTPATIAEIGLATGDRVTTTVDLPGGPIRFDARIIDGAALPHRARLQFLDLDERDVDHLARYVAATQRATAARLSGRA
jgi:hypothetical protein